VSELVPGGYLRARAQGRRCAGRRHRRDADGPSEVVRVKTIGWLGIGAGAVLVAVGLVTASCGGGDNGDTAALKTQVVALQSQVASTPSPVATATPTETAVPSPTAIAPTATLPPPSAPVVVAPKPVLVLPPPTPIPQADRVVSVTQSCTVVTVQPGKPTLSEQSTGSICESPLKTCAPSVPQSDCFFGRNPIPVTNSTILFYIVDGRTLLTVRTPSGSTYPAVVSPARLIQVGDLWP